jgi:hypothetical protein
MFLGFQFLRVFLGYLIIFKKKNLAVLDFEDEEI